MSHNYRLFLFDEFDWGYGEYKGIKPENREKVKRGQVVSLLQSIFKEKIQTFIIEANFDNVIVINTGRWFPYDWNKDQFSIDKELMDFCDACYSQEVGDIVIERIK